MTIRKADQADLELLRELWEEFEAEVPAPEHWRETWDEALRGHRALRRREDVALVAEEDGQSVGLRAGASGERARRLPRRRLRAPAPSAAAASPAS